MVLRIVESETKGRMKYTQLGKTSTKVPVIGQGSMGIGGYLSRDARSDEEQIAALRLGVELGMTFVDTAEAYGDGHSEELIGRAFQRARDRVFLATKFSPEHNDHENVLKSAELSLRRLKTDYIDLYQVHWPNPSFPLAETMHAMEQLVSEDKIKYIGVSNFSLKELKQAQAAIGGNGVVSLQAEYNLFDRAIETAVLPYCQEENVTLIAYSPLDQGRVASGDRRIQELREIAAKYGKTPAQVVLNWLISHPRVVVIPKATSQAHIRENAASSDFDLLPEDFNRIRQIFAPRYEQVPVQRIRIIAGVQGSRQVYQTAEEAKENKLGFRPSPMELARDMQDGEVLKPVRVIRSTDESGQYDYDLVEGRIRYWAWVIAYGGDKPIPVYVRESEHLGSAQ
ncbi:MAG: aldo/keto reductase [Chloroflexi bacterium]|nr:aldo/keto reductase [Chloroflexota bacterium]